MKSQKAFTLIEILIVIGIVGILASILLPWLKMKMGDYQMVQEPLSSSEEQVRKELFVPRESEKKEVMPPNPYDGKNHNTQGLLKSSDIAEEFRTISYASGSGRLFVLSQSHLYEFDFDQGMWRRLDK